MWKYKCVSENDDVLLTTDNLDDCIKAMCGLFGEPIPHAILEYGADGEYHYYTDR